MYRMLLALALAFAIRDNVTRLLEVEGGIRSFEAVHWALVALTAVMAPLCVMAFLSGWREYQEKRKEQAEETAREAESAGEKYAELLEAPEDPSEEESGSSAPEDEGASKYDS